jgi:RNA-directed DNA polymerase
VKHELRCRYYLRYCDDFILLDRDLEKLRDWRDRIGQYLAANLRLGLNPRQSAI